jgi:hypothetical protein
MSLHAIFPVFDSPIQFISVVGETLTRRFLLLVFSGVDVPPVLLLQIYEYVRFFFLNILRHTWSIERVSVPSFFGGLFLMDSRIICYLCSTPQRVSSQLVLLPGKHI